MKKFISIFLAAVISLITGLTGSAQDQNLVTKVSGSWTGTLKIQAIELTIVFNCKANDDNTFTVTIDSPDQGAKDIPTSTVRITTDSMIIKSKTLKGAFLGKFGNDFSSCTGTWKQGSLSLPLELKHSTTPFTRNRPQEPVPPFPYTEKVISFSNPSAGITLAGTLTLPSDMGKFPAAILITGSGPQNRDEELLGHKPFLVLADYLARHGIAVLRYDDRGIGNSTGDFKSATSADFATDVNAAVNFLKTQEGIDTLSIGLIGHSEGGMIAPMVASSRNDISFIVLMAGPGLTGEQILQAQTALIAKADSAKEKDITRTLKLNAKIYEVLKKYPDNKIAAEKIRKILQSDLKKNPPDKTDDKVNDKFFESQIETITSPWFRYFLTFNPVDFLRKVKCPLLAINGSLDLQVPPKEDLAAIEKAMIFGGNSNYTVMEIPGVNHLFQTATTGAPSEYGKIEETISPKVLEIISDWITKQEKK